MKSQTLFLGIDGGATKTDMVLTNGSEEILARVLSGPTNIHTVSDREIVKNLSQGIKALLQDAGCSSQTTFTAVGAGFAGIDNRRLEKKAKDLVKKSLGKHAPVNTKRIKVVNDTIIGFWSGTTSGEGLCIIGGTGSNCYGRTKKGKEAWASGLDWILADEGSGWEQGWKALRMAVKSYDGRGPKSLLENMIYKHYGIKNARDLLEIVYEPDYGKHQIGQLALYVEKAALKGDKVAKQICLESAQELFDAVHAVAKKLGFKKQHAFDIVLIGGVIQRNPIVHKRFVTLVRKQYPKASFIVPTVKPAIGSVRLAQSTLPR